MPFANTNTAYNFSEQGIARYAPRESGVYGIYNSTNWIYIGESQDMEARLYEHLRGQSDQSGRILRRNPTGYAFERCGARTRTDWEAALIRELGPVAQY